MTETSSPTEVDSENETFVTLLFVGRSSPLPGLTFPSVMVSSGIQQPFSPHRGAISPMCTRCERNRAPGASLTSLNEGHNPRRAIRPFTCSSPARVFNFFLFEGETHTCSLAKRKGLLLTSVEQLASVLGT